jgi:hypothetical protein
MDGSVLLSNNAAKFADTKIDILSMLGSVQKGVANEFLIADPLRNRAIITFANFADKSNRIVWQYDSDRRITDFRRVLSTDREILVGTSSSSPAILNARLGETVIWKNQSNQSITVVSGKVASQQFASDPDLSLYGNDFISQTIAPGERFAFKFESMGDFHWFAHPLILSSENSGVVRVQMSVADQEYILVENDTASDVVGGRVVRVDVWGNIKWSYGEGVLSSPRDARPLSDGSVIIST